MHIRCSLLSINHSSVMHTRGASNYSAAQSGSLGSVSGVRLVTDPLRTEQIRTEWKNVRSKIGQLSRRPTQNRLTSVVKLSGNIDGQIFISQ